MRDLAAEGMESRWRCRGDLRPRLPGAVSPAEVGDLHGGICIWAGIVSESETIPAQKPSWNDSRPVRGARPVRVWSLGQRGESPLDVVEMVLRVVQCVLEEPPDVTA